MAIRRGSCGSGGKDSLRHTNIVIINFHKQFRLACSPDSCFLLGLYEFRLVFPGDHDIYNN